MQFACADHSECAVCVYDAINNNGKFKSGTQSHCDTVCTEKYHDIPSRKMKAQTGGPDLLNFEKHEGFLVITMCIQGVSKCCQCLLQ